MSRTETIKVGVYKQSYTGAKILVARVLDSVSEIGWRFQHHRLIKLITPFRFFDFSISIIEFFFVFLQDVA